MADRNLYRWGQAAPIAMPRLTGFGIQRGDLVFWDTTVTSDPYDQAPSGTAGAVKSAASYPGQATLAALQAAFAAQFVGVSAQRWPVTGNVPPVFGGQDGLLRINTGGVYEFDKQSGLTFLPTQLVAPDGTAAALLPQQVNAVTVKSSAIGRVVRYAGPTALTVLVQIFTAEFSPLTNA